MKARRPSAGTSYEEQQRVRASMRAADARNAGYRRGLAGLPVGDGRYDRLPEFAEGYAQGVAAREAQS